MITEDRFRLDQIALLSKTADDTILAMADALKRLQQIHELAKRDVPHDGVSP